MLCNRVAVLSRPPPLGFLRLPAEGGAETHDAGPPARATNDVVGPAILRAPVTDQGDMPDSPMFASGHVAGIVMICARKGTEAVARCGPGA